MTSASGRRGTIQWYHGCCTIVVRPGESTNRTNVLFFFGTSANCAYDLVTWCLTHTQVGDVNQVNCTNIAGLDYDIDVTLIYAHRVAQIGCNFFWYTLYMTKMRWYLLRNAQTVKNFVLNCWMVPTVVYTGYYIHTGRCETATKH